MADIVYPTSTKVFFEKNGEPYNDPVTFTVTCYGYIVDDSDPNRKYYYRGNYQRKEPDTYNQTKVFSYSATADYYGDEIFEPFYHNLRVIDYCSLCGVTAGKEFSIGNVGDSPIPNCSMERPYPVDYRPGDDICYLPTDQYYNCTLEESSIRRDRSSECSEYLEKYDPKKEYQPGVSFQMTENGVIVATQEYFECREKAADSVDLNCSVFLEDVCCKDICDPDGNPIQRDCSLFFEIPAYEDGTIIGNDFEPGSVTGRGLLRRNIFSIIEDLREDLDISYLINKYTGSAR